MRNSTRALINYPQKNLMVLKLYWACTACVVFLQVVYFIYFTITDSFGYKYVETPEYVRAFIGVPTATFIIVGIALSLTLRRFGKSSPDKVAVLLMTGLIIFFNVVAYTHYGIAVIFVVYIFPILLSLFYNNRKLTLVTSFFALASYMILVMAYLPTRNQAFIRHDITDMLAMPAIIVFVTLTGMQILDIYSELIDKIVEQTIKKLALEREAREDPLTKLYNHAVFYESLDFAVNSFEDINTPFCIIIMDIDDFKAVNDTYGHAFGDLVLLGFSDAVRARLNESDMAFRYGGEEFSIISFCSLEDAVIMAEDIRNAFSGLRLDENPGASFTVSAGVSAYSRKYGGKREFFTSADRALYAAKRQGKNRTIIASGDASGFAGDT